MATQEKPAALAVTPATTLGLAAVCWIAVAPAVVALGIGYPA